MHDLDLLMTLAGGLGAALILGYISHRIGLSPIVGYLLAGVVVGPSTPGFIANAAIANQLAEFGVILLMFGVGLHFDVQELLRVRHIAVPGAVIQCAISFAAGLVAAITFGWDWNASIVFGLAVALASTVVVTRVLANANELQTQVGSIAIGWLIVQDVLAVLSLVLLPSFAVNQPFSLFSISMVLFWAAIKMTVVVAAITFLGGKLIPRILQHVAATKSRELFTLTILVLVLGIALISARLFGISMALGAFLAGVVVGRSDFSLRAASDALPMQDAFGVLFFVSVGMLFDPIVLVQSKLMLVTTLLIVMIVTPLSCVLIMLVLGHPMRLSLRVATSLTQVGEFSFIIATLARQLDMLPAEAMNVLVTVSIISISCSPAFQSLVNPIQFGLRRYPRWSALETARVPFSMRPAIADLPLEDRLDASHRTVIIGFGPVGKTLAKLLTANSIAATIIEMNHNSIQAIRDAGYDAVLGDANHPDTLKKAGIESSLSLILSASTLHSPEQIIKIARELNPKLKVIVRSSYLWDRLELIRMGVVTVFSGEGEVAMALAEYLLKDLGATPEQIDRERDRLRLEIFG